MWAMRARRRPSRMLRTPRLSGCLAGPGSAGSGQVTSPATMTAPQPRPGTPRRRGGAGIWPRRAQRRRGAFTVLPPRSGAASVCQRRRAFGRCPLAPAEPAVGSTVLPHRVAAFEAARCWAATGQRPAAAFWTRSCCMDRRAPDRGATRGFGSHVQSRRRTGTDRHLRRSEGSSTRGGERSMALRKFIIEREIPKVGSFEREQLRGAAAKSNQVLNQLGPDIQWVESYVANDKTFCVYLAKDEAIIRKHAEISGFPATKITEVRKMIDPTTEAA